MIPFIHRFFKDAGHHHFIDRLAEANSVISAIALYPQLASALQGGNISGLSPMTFFLTALNSAIWVAYGIHREEMPLSVSSAINGIAALSILVLILIRH